MIERLREVGVVPPVSLLFAVLAGITGVAGSYALAGLVVADRLDRPFAGVALAGALAFVGLSAGLGRLATGEGNCQQKERTDSFPSGAAGWVRRTVET